jgi:hypothetical protein
VSLISENSLQVVNEMATAAGLPSDIDPALCAAFRAMKLGFYPSFFHVTLA